MTKKNISTRNNRSSFYIKIIDGKRMFQTANGSWKEVKTLPTMLPECKKVSEPGRVGKYKAARAIKKLY